MLAEWFQERSFLADAIWQTTLFLALGLLGARVLAARPARAHALLVGCSVAALVVPFLTRALGALGIGFFGAPAASSLAGTPPEAFELAVAGDASLVDWLLRFGAFAWITVSLLLTARLALCLLANTVGLFA